MPRYDLVVIGTSTGGVEALCSVIRRLPADFGAAVLIVMHIGEASALPAVLNRCGTLPCSFVTDSPRMERGRIYIAPPNFHIRVDDGKVSQFQGPKENLFRPSIDPLFRSAARFYRERVIGVILTGALDDGSAGLFAIKNRGGLTIVQDPAEAFQPSMPAQAIRHTNVDYCLGVKKIGPKLVKLVGHRKRNDIRLKPPKAEPVPASESTQGEGGVPFAVSCPECQGPLFEQAAGKGKYFHCRVGHAFSAESLNEAHDEALERALWTTIRMLGEKITLRKTLEQKSKKTDPQQARHLRETIDSAQKEIDLLKDILHAL